MLNKLGIKHLKTMDRDELMKYAYGEIAKIAMELIHRQLTGKE